MKELAIECVIERVGESVRELDIESVDELEVQPRMAADTAWVAAPEQPYPLLTRLPTEQPKEPESHSSVVAARPASRPQAQDARAGTRSPVRTGLTALSHISARLELVLERGRLLSRLASGVSGGVAPPARPEAKPSAGCPSAWQFGRAGRRDAGPDCDCGCRTGCEGVAGCACGWRCSCTGRSVAARVTG